MAGKGIAERADAEAAELYAVPPGDFVARRDERVRALRAEGERELAAEVGKLRKPLVPAWVLNRLVNERRDQVEKLVALGPEFLTAQRQLDGEALRGLTARKQRAVSALAQEAQKLAAEAGHPVGPAVGFEVEGTLNAAVADPEVAERVLSGRLLRPESYAGFGPALDGGGRPPLRVVPDARQTAGEESVTFPEPAAPERAAGEPATRAAGGRKAAARKPAADAAAEREAAAESAAEPGAAAAQRKATAGSAAARKAAAAEERQRKQEERRAADRERAERAAAAARAELAAAEQRHTDALAEVDAAEEAWRALGGRADELRDQLAELEKRLAEASLDRRRLGHVADRAAAEVERARARVDRLGPPTGSTRAGRASTPAAATPAAATPAPAGQRPPRRRLPHRTAPAGGR